MDLVDPLEALSDLLYSSDVMPLLLGPLHYLSALYSSMHPYYCPYHIHHDPVSQGKYCVTQHHHYLVFF